MKLISTPLQGLLLIEPRCFIDERGFFLETYQRVRYREVGITDEFVQDNQSSSTRGVLRGMHFQLRRPQAQIVTVIRGHIFDVGVDLRCESPTFGRWFGVELSDKGAQRQIYMAPGFAHGFCVLSERADLHYKVSEIYDSHDEAGMLWNDPGVGIQWPLVDPVLSERDASYPQLKTLLDSGLFRINKSEN